MRTYNKNKLNKHKHKYLISARNLTQKQLSLNNTINGWKYIKIDGPPKERGRAYGLACASDFADIQKMLLFFMLESYGQSWEWFISEINKDYKHFTKSKFPEFYDEMVGIAEGVCEGGTVTTIDEILAWNFYLSIPSWYSTRSDVSVGKEGGGSKRRGNIGGIEHGQKDHCSAFIAVGKDWTEDGEIVVAHNSFSDFVDGQYAYIILDLTPPRGCGCRFIMQTSPCWIWSGTDFFITANGIIGTETTIGGFFPYELRTPIGYRIRNAMQYGKTMDDYVDMLLDGNSGDYANSWLFGDIKGGEIMRLELGLKYHNIERTKNGFFIGFNAAYDPQIRNLECVNSGFYDIRRHQGARMVRLGELMDKHKGKLNVEIAKKIIADHYDVYLGRDNPCSRTVCSHYELDAREYMSQADRPKPFSPHGALDGCVMDSKMGKGMTFWGRYGNSCGRSFDRDAFCDQHRQWNIFRPYLKHRPGQDWKIVPLINKKHIMNKKNIMTNHIVRRGKTNTVKQMSHSKSTVLINKRTLKRTKKNKIK